MSIEINFSELITTVFSIIFVLVILSIFGLIIFTIRRFFSRPKTNELNKEQLKRRWEEVESLLVQKGEMSDKLAVIEADKIFDNVLKSMMMPGSTMAERLRVAQAKYRFLEKIWWAHKLRNQLVHEATFDIKHHQAKAAIKEYRKALKSMYIL